MMRNMGVTLLRKIVIVLACIAIYGQTLSHGFVKCDDDICVTDNYRLHPLQSRLHSHLIRISATIASRCGIRRAGHWLPKTPT